MKYPICIPRLCQVKALTCGKKQECLEKYYLMIVVTRQTHAITALPPFSYVKSVSPWNAGPTIKLTK